MAQVMREKINAEFGTSAPVGVNQNAPGYVKPDFVKEAGSLGRPEGTNIEMNQGNKLLDSLVGGLAKVGAAYFGNQLNTAREEAYLNGQAAAATGKAKAEVESDVFTRDWAGAGWSDTKSRLTMADAEAQTAVDMKKLREQDPEKMKEYLQTRRKGLMPAMQGMSLEARKGMMAQMALSDQHAIAKQMTEHQKFIIDQQNKAIQTSFSVVNDAMNSSKADPQAYTKATDNAMANIWGNIVQNPNLPADMKLKLIEDAATLALAGNNEQLYEKMRDTKANGVSLLDQLPFDSQVKLAKAFQASRADTAAMRNGTYNTQLGLYQSKLDDPMAPPVSWEDHQAMVQQGVQLQILGQDKVASLAKQWADGNVKKQKGITAAAQFAAGDINGMFTLGVTEEEGAAHYITMQQRKGVSPAETAAQLAQIGSSTGQLSAFKALGGLMRSSIQQIGLGGDMDPGQLAGVNAVLGTIEQSEKKGSLAAKTSFLSSFDDDTQARLLTYWDGLKQGKSPMASAAEASTRATENASLSKADKAALGAQHSKENAELVASIEAKGLFSQGWEKAVPDLFRFKDNINRDKLSASKSWFEDPSRVEEAQSRGKVALLQELGDIASAHPYMGADARKSMALTKVAARTLTTDGGPVIMPQGQTVQTFFGVPASVGPELVQATLNDMHKAGPGNRTIYTVMADGQMQWQEKNKKGELVSAGGVFNPKELAPAVQATQDRATEKFIQTDGAGTQVKGPDGSAMRYNGNNTLGIGTNVMHMYRADLVKYEGVRNKPYKDGKTPSGEDRFSVGVGVNTSNPKHYPKVQADGTVSDADISRSFMTASDDAMKVANEYVQDMPKERQNVYATRLYGSLAYQGGSVDKSVLKALTGTDRPEALTALRGSRQYRHSNDQRKQFYEAMFNGVWPYNNF